MAKLTAALQPQSVQKPNWWHLQPSLSQRLILPATIYPKTDGVASHAMTKPQAGGSCVQSL